MKKKVVAWGLLLVLVWTVFSGCVFNKEGKKGEDTAEQKLENDSRKDKKDKEKEGKDNAQEDGYAKEEKERKGPVKMPKPKKEDAIDGYAAYRDILTHLHYVIETEGAGGRYDAGEVGIMEVLPRVLESEEIPAMEVFGYRIEDLTKDGIPELVIGDRRPDDLVGAACKIYVLYTLVDGKPELVLDGFAGFDYYLSEDGKLLEFGGYMKMQPYFGVFEMSENARDRNYIDFYFTMEKENSDTLGFFHNHVGIADPAVSEEINHNVEEEGIGAYMEEAKKMAVDLPLYPFSAYEVDEGKTYAVWGRYVMESDEFINQHYFEADKTDPQVSIVLFADRTVQNFKILNLEVEPNEKNAEITYKVEEMYSMPELNKRTPFVLDMTFYGLYPTKGFSYEEDGVVKRYTLEMSNKDGLLYFVKF